mgnify:CR=1 FL=1
MRGGATKAQRWAIWKSQEPLVDLMGVSETEVAEYRKWAGTTGWHDRIVDELVELAGGAE